MYLINQKEFIVIVIKDVKIAQLIIAYRAWQIKTLVRNVKLIFIYILIHAHRPNQKGNFVIAIKFAKIVQH